MLVFPAVVARTHEGDALALISSKNLIFIMNHSHIPLVIAIDGPAASGKGTLARKLAQRLGLEYLDTGKLYRAVGLRMLATRTDLQDEAAAVRVAQNITQEDINSERLYDEQVGDAASKVSALPKVREALLQFQVEFAKRPEGAVLDGRDIGTVICPDADIKLFITADIDSRATRRFKELSGKGETVTYEQVVADLQARDKRDSERAIAPLQKAEDAIHIDTTDLDASAVLEKVLSYVEPVAAAKVLKRGAV
jgi:cytidylate kinase